MNTSPHHPPPTFFTCTDIAARFGVTLAAVSNWRRRFGPGAENPFPAPDEGHPTPVWRWERWPEIDAWHERRGGHRPGRPSTPRQRADGRYLSMKDIAERLNVTPGAVRQWRRALLPIPFPQPDKEITQKTRTVSLWREDRWPDIQGWREWHLNHLATRKHPAHASQREDRVPEQSPETALPPPSHYLKIGRSTSRGAVRQGRVVRPNIRRRLR